MTHTAKRIETVRLLQKCKHGDEQPGDTILRALRAYAESPKINISHQQARELPSITGTQDGRLVPVDPQVKSAEASQKSNNDAAYFLGSAKSADPTCYSACVEQPKEIDMQQYPAGGPREPVYALMRSLGFSMATFGDKTWTSADKITVHIYGAGSMARITDEAHIGAVECALDELAERIDTLRRG